MSSLPAPRTLFGWGPPAGPLPARSIWMARGIAALADAAQFFLFPLFGEGVASPLNVGLDLVLCLFMTRLVGFHWSFAPTFAAELVPVLDLAPTWTAAVLLATIGRGEAASQPAGARALTRPPAGSAAAPPRSAPSHRS